MLNNKILIIDDEQAVIDSIMDSLKREEYEILTANNGQEGIEIYREINPILMILDLRMPVMSGLELLEQLKLSASDNCFVIVLTEHGDDNEMEKCFSFGISAFLRKPFNVFELIGMVKHCITLKYTQMELMDEIVEHKRAKKKGEHLASFPQLNINPILEVDYSGIITFYNDAAINVLEKPGMNKNVNLFLPEDINGIMKSSVQEYDIPLYREVVIGDRVFSENIHFLPEFKVIRIYASDITEHKQLEKEKQDMQIKMLQSSKLASLGEIATGVAHEINQPLTYISSFIQNMQDDLEENIKIDEDRLAKGLKTSYHEVNRITSIIQHLRTFGRQVDEVERQEVSIKTILDNTLLLMGERIRLCNVNLVENIGSEIPMVSANANRLEEVFINLFQNACDACHDKTENAEIHFTATASDDKDYVVIEVSDNGVGMEKKTLDRIFEPFYTTKEVGNGVGLGLSIVYGTIHKHKGTIVCRSEPGKGTTFEIRLPAEKA